VLVVIAEKDPHELQALQAAFESPDCEVVTAYDGEVVVALVRERSPDAVVVGSSLWQMGGLAAAREIKTSAEAGEHPNPVVVVLLERDADGWLAGWSRCDGWLVKPVDPLDVAELVSSLLSAPAASR
jgi:DNA-binding response OmpR family regulator